MRGQRRFRPRELRLVREERAGRVGSEFAIGTTPEYRRRRYAPADRLISIFMPRSKRVRSGITAVEKKQKQEQQQDDAKDQQTSFGAVGAAAP